MKRNADIGLLYESVKLRMRAERQVKKEPAGVGKTQGISAGEMTKTIHELRVHQLELEMQNDELRRIHEELEAARDRYSNLYDFCFGNQPARCHLKNQGRFIPVSDDFIGCPVQFSRLKKLAAGSGWLRFMAS